MPINEFAIIKRYFERSHSIRADFNGWGRGEGLVENASRGVVQGIGDDCAVLRIDPDDELVISTDTLVAGVHFPEGAAPGLIGQRALRVNLSDIAAMGGRPSSFLLALTLPELNETWLEGFSGGLHAASDAYACHLVGGNTTKGPLSITISVLGGVLRGGALLRSGAGVGDGIYVTGFLGDAAAGLDLLGWQASASDAELASEVRRVEYLQKRYWQPSPRISEGLILRDFASAAIDISDGLLADLGHILSASGLGGEVQLDAIPISAQLIDTVTTKQAMTTALTGGDDYELCFTVPAARIGALEARVREGLLTAHCIGRVSSEEGLICRDASGDAIDFPYRGYQHF